METYSLLVYAMTYIGLFLISFYALGVWSHSRKPEPKERTDFTVSIIIPAYNEEKSIENTIKTALALEYPVENIEIIVVDDGSKDLTYKIAKELETKINNSGKSYPELKVYTKPNGGKGSALNFGIGKAKSEIIVSMDADTFVKPDSLKKMLGYFYSENVAAVTPAMGVHNPKGIWQRIQHIEYYMSVFLRKSFAVLNAVHITPGAFCAYRKSFFDKYGGYDEDNLTEDMELALRIQEHHFIIENSPYAVVYTLAPHTFKELLAQRKRWYTGFIQNIWNYRRMFLPKYGTLGIVVLPAAVITLLLSIILIIYSSIKTISNIHTTLNLMQATGFQFNGWLQINKYIIEQFIYYIFTQPLSLFSLIFIVILAFYVGYSKKTMKYKEAVMLNFLIFIVTYSVLLVFFWVVSILYVISGGKVKWK